MKKFALLLLLLILLFSSCSRGKTLKVYMDGENRTLKTGNRFATLIDFSEGSVPLYNVDLIGNDIIVGLGKSSPDIFKVMPNYYSCYIGVDNGEFGGWIEYGKKDKDNPVFELIPDDIKIILNENCQGLIDPRHWNNDVILLTGLGHLSTDIGKMYILNDGNVREIYDFNSCPQAYLWDDKEDILYIKTHDKIYSYKYDEEVEILYEFEKDYGEYYDFFTKNIVKRGNSLIFGSVIGVFEFDLETQKSYWYPLIED